MRWARISLTRATFKKLSAPPLFALGKNASRPPKTFLNCSNCSANFALSACLIPLAVAATSFLSPTAPCAKLNRIYCCDFSARTNGNLKKSAPPAAFRPNSFSVSTSTRTPWKQPKSRSCLPAVWLQDRGTNSGRLIVRSCPAVILTPCNSRKTCPSTTLMPILFARTPFSRRGRTRTPLSAILPFNPRT